MQISDIGQSFDSIRHACKHYPPTYLITGCPTNVSPLRRPYRYPHLALDTDNKRYFIRTEALIAEAFIFNKYCIRPHVSKVRHCQYWHIYLNLIFVFLTLVEKWSPPHFNLISLFDENKLIRR